MLAAIQSRNQYGAIAQKLATYSKVQIAKSCRVTISVERKSIHPAASAIVIANCQIPDACKREILQTGAQSAAQVQIAACIGASA